MFPELSFADKLDEIQSYIELGQLTDWEYGFVQNIESRMIEGEELLREEFNPETYFSENVKEKLNQIHHRLINED